MSANDYQASASSVTETCEPPIRWNHAQQAIEEMDHRKELAGLPRRYSRQSFCHRSPIFPSMLLITAIAS
jgi:hypothetical protein